MVGITALADGSGYYLAAADGGVFAYNAPFFGSAAGVGQRRGDGHHRGFRWRLHAGHRHRWGLRLRDGNYGNQTHSGVVDPVVSIAS